MDSHLPVRDGTAVLERRTADWFNNNGYRVLGTHPKQGPIDQDIWNSIESELSNRFGPQAVEDVA
jgi:hypothetical protein